MKIEFRLNIQDYLEANKAHFKAQKISYYLTWFLVIVSILIAIFRFIVGDIASGIIFLLLGIILNPELSLLQKFALKRAWNNQSNTLRQVMELDASTESFFIKGENFESTIKWTVFNKFIETENLFIIYEGKALLRIVPKRAFANNEELQEFRIILQENINPNSISA